MHESHSKMSYIFFIPEMRDGDNDKQVESYSEQRDGRQQDVEQKCIGVMLRRPPAGHIEQLWKAGISFSQGVHEHGDK